MHDLFDPTVWFQLERRVTDFPPAPGNPPKTRFGGPWLPHSHFGQLLRRLEAGKVLFDDEWADISCAPLTRSVWRRQRRTSAIRSVVI